MTELIDTCLGLGFVLGMPKLPVTTVLQGLPLGIVPSVEGVPPSLLLVTVVVFVPVIVVRVLLYDFHIPSIAGTVISAPIR